MLATQSSPIAQFALYITMTIQAGVLRRSAEKYSESCLSQLVPFHPPGKKQAQIAK